MDVKANWSIFQSNLSYIQNCFYIKVIFSPHTLAQIEGKAHSKINIWGEISNFMQHDNFLIIFIVGHPLFNPCPPPLPHPLFPPKLTHIWMVGIFQVIFLERGEKIGSFSALGIKMEDFLGCHYKLQRKYGQKNNSFETETGPNKY